MKNIFFITSLIISITSFGQDYAFKLYSKSGKKTSFGRLIKEAEKADLLFIGEYHNNPISHWLEFEVTKALMDKRELTLGAEMFEHDNHDELEDFLKGKINEEDLDSLVRLWKNYKTDYKPLIELAKDNNIEFIATNIPRNYANMVYRNGFEALDSLPDSIKADIAPLPIRYDSTIKCYADMLSVGAAAHGGSNLPKAQAVKDATIAHFILQHFKKGNLFIHYNGAYHSDNYQGIVWHIKESSSELNIVTVSTVLQKDINKLEEKHLNKADFIICVDSDMTTTY